MTVEEQTDEIRQSTMPRSFGPDDLEPFPNSETGAKAKGEFEIVLGPKQLSIALFLLLAQMGLVAGIAYTVGRSSGTVQPKRAVTAAVFDVTTPAVPVVSEPVPVAREMAAVPAPKHELTPPPGLYLQVGSLDVSGASASVAALTAKGFPARLAPGSSDNTFRVLVGPVPDGKTSAITDSLGDLGYLSFPKRY
ncbi:MAG: SPOR domain-containing protein [Bryobacteraceae bacterium]